MARVVGIHGIGQQYTTGPELKDRWAAALEGGLVAGANSDDSNSAKLRAAAARVGTHGTVVVATFGDLFRRPGVLLGAAAGAPPPFAVEDLTSDDERQFVRALYESAVESDPGLTPSGTTLVAAPPSVQNMAKRLLQRPALAGTTERVLVGNVKQAMAYLTDDDVRAQVHQRVLAEVADDTRILIGHSLGSIIAHQVLAEGLAPQVTLLVTLGSPLGVPNLVFDRLRPTPVDGRAAWPGDVQEWVNVSSHGDFVAMVKALRPLFDTDGRAFTDVQVDTGGDAHKAVRYLNTAEVGQAVARWL